MFLLRNKKTYHCIILDTPSYLELCLYICIFIHLPSLASFSLFYISNLHTFNFDLVSHSKHLGADKCKFL